jgi:hypothetical protein
MAWALRSCDVYCCAGCGFTGTHPYNKGHVRPDTVQCTCIVHTGVCEIVACYCCAHLAVAWVERWHQVWVESACLFGVRQSALLIAAWDQADFKFHDATPPSGPGRPHYRGCTSHNDAPRSVELLWTSDQPDTETSAWQNTTLTTDIHAPRGIRTHNLSRRVSERPLGPVTSLNTQFICLCVFVSRLHSFFYFF